MAQTQPPSPAPQGQADLAPYLVSIDAGKVVYKQGEPGQHVYFVQRGRVELLTDPAGPAPIGVAGIGDFFGEAALLDEEPRTHTARALTACTLVKIDRPTFGDLVKRQPEVAARMLYAIVGREREQVVLQPIDPGSIPDPAPAVYDKAVLVHAASKKKFVIAAPAAATLGRPDRATGRAPEIDLSPFDSGQTLSRQHAVITWRDGRCVVKEEKATRNGTFVNDERIAPGVEVALADGDRLRCGLIELEFRTQ